MHEKEQVEDCSQTYMDAADEDGEESGRIDFPEFLAVMSKVN